MNMTNVLVTGASSGIGRAIAKMLIDADSSVTGIARSFRQPLNGLTCVELDLAKLDDLSIALSEKPELSRSFDTLILNAGIGQFGGIEQFSHAQIQRLVNTNLLSQIYILKHYLPVLRKLGGGDIVFIGSESSLQGAKQGAIYCASKFAIRGLAQSLRAECARSDIRVSLVNPGPVDSHFFDNLHFEPESGEEHALSCESVAQAVMSLLAQPRSVVTDEINIQPLKRAFRKK